MLRNRCQENLVSRFRSAKKKIFQEKRMSRKETCQEKGAIREETSRKKRCQDQGVPRERDVKRKQRKGCQEKGVSRERGVKRKGCQEKECQKKRDIKGCVPTDPPVLSHKLPTVYMTYNVAEQKVYIQNFHHQGALEKGPRALFVDGNLPQSSATQVPPSLDFR